MGTYRGGEYHIRLTHHTEAPEALADAQAAALEAASTGPRRWTIGQGAVLLLGVTVVAVLVIGLLMAPSLGRAGAYEQCVERAQQTLDDASAADPARQAAQPGAHELCAHYEG